MKLSIIISAYNLENIIQTTVDSFLRQTNRQFELIIVDDGSTDKTCEQVKKILFGYEGEYRIISKENGGVSSARNRGLMEATGDYVMFFDGDDYAADTFILSLYELLKRQAPHMVCFGYDTVDQEKEVVLRYFDTYKYMEQAMTGTQALRYVFADRAMWVWTGSAVYSRDFLRENRLTFTEGCANGEDQEFAIKALSRAGSVTFLNQVLTFYVLREGSMSSSRNIRKFDVIPALKRACDYLTRSNDKDLIRIADLIAIEKMTENYFNSLDTCLAGPVIRPLLDQIDAAYPGLTAEMKQTMRRYRRRNDRIDRKRRLFLISPGLYAKVLFLKRRIKRCEKRWKE